MGKGNNNQGDGGLVPLPGPARAAIFIAGIYLSWRQRKRAKKEAERARRLAARREVSFGDNDSTGVVLYGRTAYRPQPVFYGTHANFERPDNLVDGTFLGNILDRNGRTNEFLMIETVPSVGELESIVRVIGDANERNTALHFHLMTHGGAPTEFTNTFRFSDRETAKYSFWTRVQSIYRNDVANPVFSSAPVVMFEFEGVRTPNITKDGTNPAVVESTRTYNRDIASVWLDFLTRPRVNNRPEYGPGLSYSDLDLESFYRAKTIASAEVEPGHLRHMFNGPISTEDDHEEVFEILRSIAPGTQLFRAWDTGLWKLVLPHPDNRTNVIFNERNIVGDVEIVRPGINDRLNSISVSFTSARQDFTEENITYPTPGSTVSNDLLALDNNTHLATSISLAGVTSAKQANSIAYMMLQRSRREQITWETRITGALTEPGDIVTVSLDAQNIEYEVLVQQVEIFDDFSVRIVGVRWFDADYNYVTRDDEALIPVNVIDTNFVRPSEITLTDMPARRQIQVQVNLTEEQDAGAPFYEYQVEIDSVFRPWITTAATSVLYDVPLLVTNDYRFRARATNGQGRHSPWRESTQTITYTAYTAITGSDIEIETIFAITSTSTPPTAPLNAWGYDSPVAPWSDGATAAAPGEYTWRSERTVTGSPSVGDPVSDDWGPVTLFSYFALDGAPGADGLPGRPGADGAEGAIGETGERTEWIFTKAPAGTTSVPTPPNSFPFDQPGTHGGYTWTDGAPSLAVGEVLFLCQRQVPGATLAGGTVPNQAQYHWQIPALVGRNSVDGADGARGERGVPGTSGSDGDPGEDGNKTEWIFAKTDGTVSSLSTPLASWDYDEPGVRNGVQWYDGAPSLLPGELLWLSQRQVPGNLNAGDNVPNQVEYRWSTPAVVGRNGPAGDAGAPGTKTEYCYTVSGRLLSSMPTSQRPLNSWPYTGDAPVMRFASTRQWRFDAFPGSYNLPSEWRSSRQVPADLEPGDTVPSGSRYAWSTPVVFSSSPVLPLTMTAPANAYFVQAGAAFSQTFQVRVVGGPSYVDFTQSVWMFWPSGFNPVGTPASVTIGGYMTRSTGVTTGSLPSGFSISEVEFGGTADSFTRLITFRLTYTSGVQSANIYFTLNRIPIST